MGRSQPEKENTRIDMLRSQPVREDTKRDIESSTHRDIFPSDTDTTHLLLVVIDDVSSHAENNSCDKVSHEVS